MQCTAPGEFTTVWPTGDFEGFGGITVDDLRFDSSYQKMTPDEVYDIIDVCKERGSIVDVSTYKSGAGWEEFDLPLDYQKKYGIQ